MNMDENTEKAQEDGKNEELFLPQIVRSESTIYKSVIGILKVRVVYRPKVISFLRKVLLKIDANPKDEKYRRISREKIGAKLRSWNAEQEGIDFLRQAGFSDEGPLLVMSSESIGSISQSLTMLSKELKKEADALTMERSRVIQANHARLNSPTSRARRAKKNQILKEHSDQMAKAKKGLFNVKESVSCRKGNKASQPKSLGL